MPQLGIVAMAVLTFDGCVLVNDDDLVAQHFRLGMALGAGYFGVATREREMGLGVVVEGRGNPVLRIVAIRAMSLGIFCDELTVMRVDVTCLTLLRRALKA